MTPTPPGSSGIRPTAVQAVATLVGGVVLAGSTCAGFWATLNLNQETLATAVTLILFGLGLVVTFLGVVLVLLRQARLASAGKRAAQMAGASSLSAAPSSGAGRALAIAGGLGFATVICGALLSAISDEKTGIVLFVVGAMTALGCTVFGLIAAVRWLASR